MAQKQNKRRIYIIDPEFQDGLTRIFHEATIKENSRTPEIIYILIG